MYKVEETRVAGGNHQPLPSEESKPGRSGVKQGFTPALISVEQKFDYVFKNKPKTLYFVIPPRSYTWIAHSIISS